jgi:hypothetical protein
MGTWDSRRTPCVVGRKERHPNKAARQTDRMLVRQRIVNSIKDWSSLNGEITERACATYRLHHRRTQAHDGSCQRHIQKQWLARVRLPHKAISVSPSLERLLHTTSIHPNSIEWPVKWGFSHCVSDDRFVIVSPPLVSGRHSGSHSARTLPSPQSHPHLAAHTFTWQRGEEICTCLWARAEGDGLKSAYQNDEVYL